MTKTFPKICTLVIGKDLPTFLRNLKKTQQQSDFIELRVDYIAGLKISDLAVIRANTIKEAVLTCRRSDEGGHFAGDEENRLAMLEEAARLGFDYLDIELATLRQSPQAAVSANLIVSYHNFLKTPPLLELKKIIGEAKKYRPKIIKIAAQVNNEADNRRLLSLLLLKRNVPLAIIGMGELGRGVRIMAPLLGSFCAYATVGKTKTAAGQMGLGEMRSLYRKILKR